jgi:hypothetical protein
MQGDAPSPACISVGSLGVDEERFESLTSAAASSTSGVLMIEGMSRDEIRESLPEGFCDDCWQQSLDRAPKFGTNPDKDYHDVFYVTHIWDGM